MKIKGIVKKYWWVLVLMVIAAYFLYPLTMTSSNWVRAKVVNSNGDPVSGIRCRVEFPDEYEQAEYTNRFGEATFEGDGENGAFPVGIQVSGYCNCGGKLLQFSEYTRSPPWIITAYLVCDSGGDITTTTIGECTNNDLKCYDNKVKWCDDGLWKVTQDCDNYPGSTCACMNGDCQCHYYTTTITTTTIDDDTEPNIVEYKSPKITVDGTKVTVTVYVKNVGGDMTQNYIIELQPRESGLLPLSVFISPQKTCDASHPENVHRDFSLDAGEKATIVLESYIDSGSEYDLYLLGRSKCYSEYPAGNEIIGPWGQWDKIGTTKASDDGDYIQLIGGILFIIGILYLLLKK